MSKEIDFSKYLSLKIGNILPIEIIKSFDYDKNLRVIGLGYNLLIAPDAKNLAILDERFDYIKEQKDYIEIGARTRSSKIFKFFEANDLEGLEFLKSLPGSLGGLIKMNAGMKDYEMKNVLDSVCVNGEWVDASELGFSYRQSQIDGVIFAARFKKNKGFRKFLLEQCSIMRKTHPSHPSCGSCFKNPQGDFAGRLLEAVGMKGYYINGVGFSQKHANFLVNTNKQKADFESALRVIALAQKKVWEEFGIKLQKEVIIMQ